MVDALDNRAGTIAISWASVGEEVFDELDRAQLVSEAVFAAALDAALAKARAQLVHALAVLDAGGHGTCEDCMHPIGAARLAFRPESTKCLDCQAASDRNLEDVGSGGEGTSPVRQQPDPRKTGHTRKLR